MYHLGVLDKESEISVDLSEYPCQILNSFCNTWFKYEIAFIKELDKYQKKNIISISMSKSVTIVLDDDQVKKLRYIQSKKISKSTEYVSFSKIINDELRKTVK